MKNIELGILNPEEEAKIKEALIELFDHARRANEGQEGVVFSIAVRDLPKSLLEVLNQEGIEIEGDVASKVLKVYDVEKGKREYGFLKKAWELIEALPSEERSAFAGVPKPIYFADVDASGPIRDYFVGSDIQIGDRMAVIMMDFIEGSDVLEILCKKVLELRYKEDVKNGVETTYGVDGLDEHSFSQLYSLVANHFGFALPSKSESDAEIKSRIALEFSKLRGYLQKNGIVLNKKILLKLEKTLSLFRKNKLRHGDLVHNLRNIMVSGDIWGDEDVEVDIIDFGKAEIGSVREDQGVYGDEGVLEEIRQFIKTKRDETTERAKFEIEKEILPIIGRPKYLKRFGDALNKLLSFDTHNIFDMLEKYFEYVSDDEDVRMFMAFCVDAFEKNIKIQKDIIDFLRTQGKRTDLQARITERLLGLVEYLENN